MNQELKNNIWILIKFIYNHSYKLELDCKLEVLAVLKAADRLKDILDKEWLLKKEELMDYYHVASNIALIELLEKVDSKIYLQGIIKEIEKMGLTQDQRDFFERVTQNYLEAIKGV
jgi:hypothetical protein